MDQALHDKLAKVLRLSENEGATEGERAAALAMAQKIAFQHDLDLSEINLSSADNRVGEAEAGVFDNDWEGMLLAGIGLANFCRIYSYNLDYAKEGRRRVILVGRPHHIEATNQMFDYVHPQMEAEALREVKIRGQLPRYALIAVMQWMKRHPEWFQEAEVPKFEVVGGVYVYDQFSPEFAEVKERALKDLIPLLKGDTGLDLIMSLCDIAKAYASEVRPFIKRGELAPEVVRDLKSWKYSFQVAMTNRVYERIMQARYEAVKEAGEYGNALVVQEDAAVQAYYDDLDLDEGNESQRRHDPQGAVAGRAAGDNVSITTSHLTQVSRKEIGA
jgi:hypothetical protein